MLLTLRPGWNVSPFDAKLQPPSYDIVSDFKSIIFGDDNFMSLGDIRNLDYTVLLCSKMQETKQFYLDVMGFPLAHDSERWVSFQVGSALLTLKPRGPGVAWNDGPIAPGSAAVQLAFRVAPHLIDSCHATLQSKGVTILSPPRDIPSWRHRALFFRDPEDNVIEIYAEV